ncbi:sulfite reductase flavoprotein subunit alpha [Novilysobacter erysipheiresistens]|uniref:Sulfite reductase flavoprotein subunit alpha n=1 Tax=Novilysobacter erysipheiresistens TaxID=1749332 RepID=A0ABU7YUQ9_9GAMM
MSSSTLSNLSFRNAIFQLHWLFGITAGVVLALVGFTGGMLSFEDELLKALNPGVMTVEPRGAALSPEALVERVRAQRPDDAIASLQLSADPRDSAYVGFAAKDGGRRGERVHVDPYDGRVLPEPRYKEFFSVTMKLHRWLVADEVGKQIVGASTVILIFFCVSGLYLRWPRRWGSLRTWLGLDWRQKGRNFLWHLHSIVGTWVLVAYLVMSLTGLWWSYDWYRSAVNDWAGRDEQAQPRENTDRGTPPPIDIAATWQAFNAVAPAWSNATLNWPDGAEPIGFRYLDADPAHERARNELQLDRWSLEVVDHQRYDDGSWRQKIGASMFALHRGSFFGTTGVVVFMLASLLMPLFAITGWMLYLDRGRKQRAAAALAGGVASLTAPQPRGPAGGAPVLVAYASQTGTAEGLAWQTAAALREGGCAVDVQPLGKLDPAMLAAAGQVLFIASSFGEGEAPDHARAFVRRMRDGAVAPTLAGLRYGVLALGDREYGDSYCGFGRTLDLWLHHAGAQPLFDRIDVDGADAGALRHWQHHIGQLAGRSDLPDWSVPRYRRWRLAERRLLNPGSAGAPAFHLALVPEAASDLDWSAGDIAEVGPRHASAEVAAWLRAAAIDGDAPVQLDGHDEPFAAVVARSRLPDPDSMRGQPPQTVAEALKPLPHREYSIASLPADGSLQLLVRQMRGPDGRFGSGSGWLTEHADPDSDIDLRIRCNPSFHPPVDDRPLLLIGNGTGLAGLRAVLKARIAAGHRRNWLVFGERSAAHDGFHGDELERWQRDGGLPRLDRVFSRDQVERRYVQHLLGERVDEVRRWIGEDGAIYVCGSLEGMAPAVDAVLGEILGGEMLEAMAADGRYRRDVY